MYFYVFLCRLPDGHIEGVELLTDPAYCSSEMEKLLPVFPKLLGKGHDFIQSVHVQREDS